MRIVIEIEGGCIVGIQVDADHDRELEVYRVDADCREQGDDAVQDLDYWVVTPAEFDASLEAERAKDAEASLAEAKALAESCGASITIDGASITVEPLDDTPEGDGALDAAIGHDGEDGIDLTKPGLDIAEASLTPEL